MSAESAASVACRNQDHVGRRPPEARYIVEWPDGTFDQTTACARCADWLLRLARDHGAAVLFRPIAKPDQVTS